MPVPVYLLDKIARHGTSSQRLIFERQRGDGEFASMSETAAIAFDAADYIWTFLCLQGNEAAQESRFLRNVIAETLIKTLDLHLGEVQENNDHG